jgi:hypothetical protein
LRPGPTVASPDAHHDGSFGEGIQDGRVKITFYIVGAVIELAGIVLVASPDLFPGAIRLAAWSRQRLRQVETRIRRLLRRKPRSIVHAVHASDSIQISGSASAVVSTGARTLEEKVEYLLRRDTEAQDHMNKLVDRVKSQEERLTRKIDTLRAYLEGHIDHRIAEVHRDYQTARFIGVAALVLGLGLSTAANLV